tara:strand:+ start:460 stop:945 length:486 start_codon:yes stop_codon:yes gene_type:complete
MKILKKNLFGIPVISYIVIVAIFFGLYLLIENLKKWEKNQVKKVKNNEIVNKNNTIFSFFMIQRNVIPLTIGVLLSLRIRTFINILVDTVVDPLFQVDYTNDGHPDLTKLLNLFNITVFGLNYNFGVLFLEIIKIVLFCIVVYFFILVLYLKTDFLNVEVK